MKLSTSVFFVLAVLALLFGWYEFASLQVTGGGSVKYKSFCSFWDWLTRNCQYGSQNTGIGSNYTFNGSN